MGLGERGRWGDDSDGEGGDEWVMVGMVKLGW